MTWGLSGPNVRYSPLRGKQRSVDALTRAVVAALQLLDFEWFHTPEPGGSQEVGSGPRQRSAVGASGRRLKSTAPSARPASQAETLLTAA